MPLIAKKAALLLVFTMFLTACGAAATPEQSALEIVLTEGVQTMVAGHFLTQTALVTPPAPAAATLTPLPSYTPLGPLVPLFTPSVTMTRPYYTATLGTLLSPTATGTLATATINPASLAYGCDNLIFIRDVSVPNGTVMKPGQDFKRTWKVMNTGTCKWLSHYALVLVSGPALNAKSPTNIGREVAVNDWNELSLGMGAPKSAGTYTAYWRLQTADGHPFGETLVVSIKVEEPTKTPVPATKTTAPSNTAAPTNTTAPSDTPVPTDTPAPTDTSEPE